MRWLACLMGLVALLLDPAAAVATVLPGLVREPLPLSILLPDGRQVTLESMVIRPAQPGRFPLVVLVHGTPRGPREIVSPATLMGPAVAFAQRGYAAVSIMRRGFGHSDGPYAETSLGTCANRDYLTLGRISAQDVLGAVEALRNLPWVDRDWVLLLGWSTGGLAVTAAAASKPAGVIGILDFAGGRGSYAPDEVCSPDHLVQAFGRLGRSVRIPALWIYAENDHFFGPALAQRMFAAYAASGAVARLAMLPPFGNDGHSLVLAAPELWWPPVATFLATLSLPTPIVVDLPPLPALALPPAVNRTCSDGFLNYAVARTDAKAFAINAAGHCVWILAARSLTEAKQQALTKCNERWTDCTLYAAGHALFSP